MKQSHIQRSAEDDRAGTASEDAGGEAWEFKKLKTDEVIHAYSGIWRVLHDGQTEGILLSVLDKAALQNKIQAVRFSFFMVWLLLR